MSVVIQTARVGDAAVIADVHIASLHASHQGELADQVLAFRDVEQRAWHWRAWLERSQASTLVAQADGTVIGFCALYPMREDATREVAKELAALYVLPSHWRRGMVRLLCEQTLEEACSRGYLEVLLWVLEPNERARRFYESLGFQPVGTRRVFHERPDASVHELRYRRSTQ